MYKLVRSVGRAIGYDRWIKHIPGASSAVGLYMLVSHGGSPLKSRGWFKSWNAKNPLSASGQPIPWLSYPSIHLLESRITDPTLRVFEYGAGNSTLWWASRVEVVHSVEHNLDWVNRLTPQLPENATVHYVDLADVDRYVTFAETVGQPFDVVVIDGRKRSLCAESARKVLSERGVMIWDNSERTDYQSALDDLVEQGFRRLDLWGLSPGAVAESCTSILYRDGNLLGL